MDISHLEVRLSLDPFAIILPQVASRNELAGQHDDGDYAQQELDQTPKPNLDFGGRVRFLRPNLLPFREPLVSLALARGPFLVFLLLLAPEFLVPVDNNKKVRITANGRRRNLIGTRRSLDRDKGENRRKEETALTLGTVDSHCK